MGVSTTRRINLSMWISIYSFSDTYYVWVACVVFDFGQGLRYDVVCTLDTAAVTELWRLELFSCTSSSFLCAGTLSPRGKCCYFCGRFSWSRQTSLSKGFFYYFHDSITESYFRSSTRQCRCYSKTKTTKYCLKHEGKSHPCHPWQN